MTDTVTEPRTVTLTIVNQRGLHARASAKFVKCLEFFDAEVSVSRDGHTVGGGSIMGLLMLGASKGTQITVTASGPEADEAIAALTELVGDGFGEDGQHCT
ncbi:phosphocarrier protein HPr [Amorphus suaedae]